MSGRHQPYNSEHIFDQSNSQKEQNFKSSIGNNTFVPSTYPTTRHL